MHESSDRPAFFGSAETRRSALAGLSATLVGIGIARFGYTPLLPILISEHWFTQSAAAYLGAANFAGYLLGALLGGRLTRWIATSGLLRLAMLLTAASLIACAWRDLGFAWFFLWRFVAGATGGTLMVVTAPVVLSHTSPSRRGFVSGVIFTGVGLGIAASGTIVPLVAAVADLKTLWIGFGVIALLLSLAAWRGWPQDAGTEPEAPPPAPRIALGLPVAALLVEYGLNAAGIVPHMLFLVDFVARGLGRGLAAGASYWVVFGAAAMLGPVLTGHLADKIGFRAALRCGFVLQLTAVALLVLVTGAVWLMISTAIIGAFTPGIGTLVLGRAHELVEGHEAQSRAWARSTVAWALAQAVAAYGYSFLLDRMGSYEVLFSLGALALAAALGLDLVAGFGRPSGREATPSARIL